MQNTHFILYGGGITFWVWTWGAAQKSVYYLYKDVTMEEPEHNEEEPLTELEKLELERIMLYAAYENSYRVLTNKISFNDLIDEKDALGYGALMAYDPSKGIREDELELMIKHFVELDEPEYYLRCAELRDIREKMNNEKDD